jgi:hypothetical protein
MGCHVRTCVDLLTISSISDMPTASVGMAPNFPQQKLFRFSVNIS